MRKVALLGLGLVLLSGCDVARNLRRDDPRQNPSQFGPPPPAADLVRYLNQNVYKVQAVQSTQVIIDAKHGLKPAISMDGLLACQKPLNFRLKVKAFGKPGADLGSNNEEYWFWTSQDDPPTVYHCSHQERPQVQLAIPVKPEMIITALGLAEYDPGRAYDVKRRGDTLELIESTTDQAGKRIQKVTVFNASTVSPPAPQVTGYILRDEATGKDICSATVKEVKFDPATQAVLPRVVRLAFPTQRLELTMKMVDIQSVQIDPTRGARLFSRQELGGFPSFDMARNRPDSPTGYSQGSSLQRTGGLAPGRGGW